MKKFFALICCLFLAISSPCFAQSGGGIGGSVGSVQLIQTQSLSGTNTVTFSSIPQTYTHLWLIGYGLATTAGTGNSNGAMIFNSDSSAHYGKQDIVSNSSAASNFSTSVNSASNITIFQLPTAGDLANVPMGFEAKIPAYTSTASGKVTLNKYFSISTNATNGLFMDEQASVWTGTAAITNISITISSGNFAAGSVISLYGIQ